MLDATECRVQNQGLRNYLINTNIILNLKVTSGNLNLILKGDDNDDDDDHDDHDDYD